MTTLTISVPDISCGHCKSSIEGDVHTTLGEIVAAIEAQGYEVAS